MQPKTPMNHWILSKIATNLTDREGCEVAEIEFTESGGKVTVQDAFGFRYEVLIKTLSRKDNSEPAEVEKYFRNPKASTK